MPYTCHPERSVYSRAAKDLEFQNRFICESKINHIRDPSAPPSTAAPQDGPVVKGRGCHGCVSRACGCERRHGQDGRGTPMNKLALGHWSLELPWPLRH